MSLTPAIQPLEATLLWLEKAVIGLNLCPFARAPQTAGTIRWVVSEARDTKELLADLSRELLFLQDADPLVWETTLLIVPHVLEDFGDYNEFLDVADGELLRLRLDGEIQVASFHPLYQFADSGPQDVENYTNRSPYPILHLLRETSVARAVAGYPDTARIYERNMETLRRLGRAGWQRLWGEPA